MIHLAIFGANKIDGNTVDLGETIVGLALFGGLEFDFTQCPAPEGAELTIFAVFDGATVKVRERGQCHVLGPQPLRGAEYGGPP